MIQNTSAESHAETRRTPDRSPMSSPALRSASMSSALATLAAPAASAAAAPPARKRRRTPERIPLGGGGRATDRRRLAFHGGFVLVRVVAVDAPHVVLPVAFVGVDGVRPGESTRGGVPRPLQPRRGGEFRRRGRGGATAAHDGGERVRPPRHVDEARILGQARVHGVARGSSPELDEVPRLDGANQRRHLQTRGAGAEQEVMTRVRQRFKRGPRSVAIATEGRGG